MAEVIKTKVDLTHVTHSVRAAQAVLQYGVGAMVDFPDQTLVTSAPEYWSGTSRIYDDRFAKALDVDYFALPTNIAYVRFPEWYFCPKCRTFQPLKKWIAEYKKKAKRKELELDENMVTHMQCPTCKQDLVVSRIVTVCEDGHLNDFPWIKWVHARAKKPICGSPSLKFKTGASGSEGLEGLLIECSCGAHATLKDAFDKDIFEKMDQKEGSFGFRCEGHHPFKHTQDACGKYPRTVQRGASSVYFPLVHSSLVIPPYADKLNTKIEQSNAYEECIVKIEDEDTLEEKLALIKKRFSKWVEKIALEIGALQSDVEKVLATKWLTPEGEPVDVTGVKYRFEEYMALTGEISTPKGSLGDFSREPMPIEEYKLLHVKSVSLVDKVRVVNALTGFSRITPAMNKDDVGFVSVKKPDTRWYPAYEVRGEGIFIEFCQDEIDQWIENNPEILQRAERLNTNYAESFIGKNHPRVITPKFIMLHTLSHLLITQLSFECGYSIASLSERLYCSEETDGKQMSGILIYTASGDSEGTLGGLVRQGRPDAFPRIFKKAVNSAKSCSNDPVCIMSHGQGRDSLNLAACHACALLPETCCEERNAFLDRGMITGTFEHRDIGFWSDLK
jgi:hypothetical protein